MKNDISVTGKNISVAWARTLVAVDDAPDHKAVHVVTRISEPTAEDPRIRELVDGMLESLDCRPVETVANTIFPAAMAAQTPDPEDLAKRYQAVLPTIKRIDAANRRGTYFDRLSHYPAPDGTFKNQVAEIIRRIAVERASNGGPKTARYEVGLMPFTVDVPVQEPTRDTSTMDFPCLSFLSFQLDRGKLLHVVAHYRSHYLVQRAYGNYLAIGRLLNYICNRASIAPGSMTVVAGYAQVELHANARIDTIRPYAAEDAALI
ncbi:MAG TPA: hypothetical protein VGE38_03500 [Nocardioides sp.]|uniref:hypothetical protein n=1 Tax=Nocardioides sp. TaxID=35761 RepID=UPI002ED9DAF1